MENLVPPPNPGGVDTKKKTCTLRKNEAKWVDGFKNNATQTKTTCILTKKES